MKIEVKRTKPAVEGIILKLEKFENDEDEGPMYAVVRSKNNGLFEFRAAPGHQLLNREEMRELGNALLEMAED